jgi:hypothetical protein
MCKRSAERFSVVRCAAGATLVQEARLSESLQSGRADNEEHPLTNSSLPVHALGLSQERK